MKLYYAPRMYSNETIPLGYHHLKSFEELQYVSGPAVAFRKKIIIATRSYDTVPSADHLTVIRLH